MKIVQFAPYLISQEVTLDNIFVLKGHSFYGKPYKLGDIIYFISVMTNEDISIKSIVEDEIETFLNEYFLVGDRIYTKKINKGE